MDCWSCARIGSLGRTSRIPLLSIEVRCPRKQLHAGIPCLAKIVFILLMTLVAVDLFSLTTSINRE